MKKILVVDDSALMRRVLFDIINSDENLTADKYAVNGLDALEILKSGQKFDAIVLDINMPKMNGIEFLRELRKMGMRENVLIVSTLAKEDAKETIQALELGAIDFLTKPDSLSEAKGTDFSSRLISMLHIAASIGSTEKSSSGSEKPVLKKESAPKRAEASARPQRKPHLDKSPVGKGANKLVALACSTGGPKALQYVIPFLPANLDAPVLIVQHMPEGFTSSLSTRLDELSRVNVRESLDGETIKKGNVYLAKGGSQMRLLEKSASTHVLSVRTDEPARGGLKPCADIMYESLVNSSFDEITCVVLTGMGADGTKGILQLEQTNKIYVIAQDEPTSTVYGMPKAVYNAGVVDEVVALKGIADAITKHVGVR
ncbi:MAG: chemotaxis-specific protein-glutamate methyltransferase CheB [Lachnospiraceae bacterium]|nr:chemotaxis-specific protein-glutamate methyltransferase CheB [Lachnospiraceae bacterium]